MHLSLLLLSSFLLSSFLLSAAADGETSSATASTASNETTTVNPSTADPNIEYVNATSMLGYNFTYIKPKEFFEMTTIDKGNVIWCKFGFCHGDPEKKDCYQACSDMKDKFDDKVTNRRINDLNSTKTFEDNNACVERCKGNCGANDCSTECGKACEAHFSFANRKEYETEIYEFMIRVVKDLKEKNKANKANAEQEKTTKKAENKNRS